MALRATMTAGRTVWPLFPAGRRIRCVSHPDDDDDDLRAGPVLNADGRLERRFERVEPAHQPPPPPVPTEELELDVVVPPRIERPLENFRAAPPDPRRRWALPVFLGGLIVIGLAVLFVLVVKPRLPTLTPDGVTEPTLLDQLDVSAREPLIISSTPTGARLTINGAYIGDTPWAGDNRWVGTVPVVLEVRGYKRWEGSIEGGKAKSLDVRLERP